MDCDFLEHLRRPLASQSSATASQDDVHPTSAPALPIADADPDTVIPASVSSSSSADGAPAVAATAVAAPEPAPAIAATAVAAPGLAVHAHGGWITVKKVVAVGNGAHFVDTDDRAVPVPPVFWATLGGVHGPPASGRAAGHAQPSLMGVAPRDKDGTQCWLVGNMAAYGQLKSRRTYLSAIAPTAVLAPLGVSRIAVSSLVRVCLDVPLPPEEAVALIGSCKPARCRPRLVQEVDDDHHSASDTEQRRSKRKPPSAEQPPAANAKPAPKPPTVQAKPASKPAPAQAEEPKPAPKQPAPGTGTGTPSAAPKPVPKPSPATVPSAEMVLARVVGWAEGRGLELPPFVAAWTARTFPPAAPRAPAPL